LGSNIVYGVSAVGTNVYAATSNGLSVSTDGGTSFINKTTADGLGSNTVNGVSAEGTVVFAATSNGLSISTNGGTSFINKNAANGLSSNTVNGVYAVGNSNNSVIDFFAATPDGLNYSYCLDCNSDGDFFRSFSLITTRDGLGSNIVNGMYLAAGDNWAATANGLSYAIDFFGRAWNNYTTANSGLGSNSVQGVYVVGNTLYAATSNGLSVITSGETRFTNYTTADGLGSNDVRSVYALGGTLFVGTANGLNVSTNSTLPFTRYTNLTGAPLGSTQAYDVSGLYADGSTVYAASAGSGLGIGT
jgi:hypothetical protein